MIAKTDIDLGRALLLKQARGLVRLIKSAEADVALNTILPQLEVEYNKAVLKGELPEDTISALLPKVASRVA